MYCVKCGVELEEFVEECPLCKTKVPKLKDEYGNEIVDEGIYKGEYPTININIYDIKMKKIKKAVFLSFLTISVISIIEVFLQNILIYGKMEWGYYAIPSILVFDLLLFVLLNSYTIRQNLFLLLMGMSSYFLILDFHDKLMIWSLRRALPINITLYLLGVIFSFVWDKHKNNRIMVMNFFLFFVGVFLLILEFIVSRRLMWSLWASIPLFVLNIMLRYVYKSYKEEFKKRLHL